MCVGCPNQEAMRALQQAALQRGPFQFIDDDNPNAEKEKLARELPAISLPITSPVVEEQLR